MENIDKKSNLFIPQELIDNEELNYSQQFILSFILKYSKHGICHLKKIELSKISGINYGTLRIIISQLRKKGFLKDIDNGLAVFLNNKHFILDHSVYGK